MANGDKVKSVGVEAVDKALRILQCFRDGDASLSLHEISERTGFYKSLVLRMIASLENAGCLVRLPDKTYALGSELMRLGALYQRALRLDQHVRPALRDLTRATGESSTFYRLDGDKRLCLFREDSQQSIRDHIREGDRLALDKGSAGHVLTLFSNMPSDDAQCRTLIQQLPLVSYAERDRDSASMSVPIFAGGQALAGALALSGPLSRFTRDRVAEMAVPLLAAGRALSLALGGVPV